MYCANKCHVEGLHGIVGLGRLAYYVGIVKVWGGGGRASPTAV